MHFSGIKLRSHFVVPASELFRFPQLTGFPDLGKVRWGRGAWGRGRCTRITGEGRCPSPDRISSPHLFWEPDFRKCRRSHRRVIPGGLNKGPVCKGVGTPGGNPGLEMEELLSPGAGREEGRENCRNQQEKRCSICCLERPGAPQWKQTASPREPLTSLSPRALQGLRIGQVHTEGGEQRAAGGCRSASRQRAGGRKEKSEAGKQKTPHTVSDSLSGLVNVCVCLHSTRFSSSDSSPICLQEI